MITEKLDLSLPNKNNVEIDFEVEVDIEPAEYDRYFKRWFGGEAWFDIEKVEDILQRKLTETEIEDIKEIAFAQGRSEPDVC